MTTFTALSLRVLKVLVCAGLAQTAWADNHALIMGVSAYPRQPLPGVLTDLPNARQLARQMNVPDANIVMKTDRELTLPGLRLALDQLSQRVRAGDRVFIYFSGHGTSYDGAAGQCEQGLVTHDMEHLSRQEFQERIQSMVDRAAKTIVFLDTCFSGGVVQHAAANMRAFDEDESVAKYVSIRADGKDSKCGQGVNEASRSVRDFGVEKAAASTPNYYFLGASGPDEVAIDGGLAIGGYATSAFIGCTKPGAGADSNGDGVITLEEATLCAQRRVNAMILEARRRPRFPFIAMNLTSGSGPGAGATPVAFDQAPGSSSPVNSASLLETIQHGADAKQTVKLLAAKNSFKIGADFLEMSVNSSRAGYLTLFSVGSSGKIYKLFPNKLDSNNRISAGETLQLPRPEWRLRSLGPVGRSRFLAVVTPSNRFESVGLPEGPFAALPATSDGARELMNVFSGTPANCVATTVRDFGVESSACQAGYGAGLAIVVEQQ